MHLLYIYNSVCTFYGLSRHETRWYDFTISGLMDTHTHRGSGYGRFIIPPQSAHPTQTRVRTLSFAARAQYNITYTRIRNIRRSTATQYAPCPTPNLRLAYATGLQSKLNAKSRVCIVAEGARFAATAQYEHKASSFKRIVVVYF